MYIHEKWGTIFEIGDPVIYRSIKGIVEQVDLPTQHEPGYYTIRLDDGQLFTEYHYTFELDIESYRDKKIDLILNKNGSFHTENNIKETISKFYQKIDKINNKINFLKKHRNIIERREEILSNMGI
jgi:hypothetical protein